jgi:hypothetical protein
MRAPHPLDRLASGCIVVRLGGQHLLRIRGGPRDRQAACASRQRLVDALSCLRKRLDESAATGSAYRADLAGLTDELGFPGLVLGRVRAAAPEGRPARDYPARLAAHHADPKGTRGMCRFRSSAGGRPLPRGVHAENLRPRTARRPAPGHSRPGQDPQDRLETVKDPTFRLPAGRSHARPDYDPGLRMW